MARPREFDGPPVSVRLTAQLHDELAREAVRRAVDMSDVIRERLAAGQGHPYHETRLRAESS